MIAAGSEDGRFSQISPSRRALIRRMQRIGFGRITFQTRAGEPDPAHRCRTVRTVKLAGSPSGALSASSLSDFALRREHVALLATLGHVPDGACVTIEVKYGLPFKMTVEEVMA